jgi:hypothetical protein
MQSATHCHHHIARAIFPQSDGIFDHPTTFHTTDDRFNEYALLRDCPILCFLFVSQFFSAWFFVWLYDRDTFQNKALKAQVLD